MRIEMTDFQLLTMGMMILPLVTCAADRRWKHFTTGAILFAVNAAFFIYSRTHL